MNFRMLLMFLMPPVVIGAKRCQQGSCEVDIISATGMLRKTQSSSDVSVLLRAWSDGDQKALERLTPIVYDELRKLARRYMRAERHGHSLQATALVNEAYT